MLVKSLNANDSSLNLAKPSSGVEAILQIADASAASDTRLTEIDIDRTVLSSSVADYETGYKDGLHAGRIGVMISDGQMHFSLTVGKFGGIMISAREIGKGQFCRDNSRNIEGCVQVRHSNCSPC